MKYFSIWAVVAAFSLSTPLFGQDVKPIAEAPTYKVGEEWRYRLEIKSSGGAPSDWQERVERIEGNEVWFLRTALDGKQTWRVSDALSGALKSEYAFDPVAPKRVGAVARGIQPPGNWSQFPLEIGKSYPVIEHWTNSQGHNGRSDLKAKVVSLEKIKLEGGEIDAFRIELSGWWNNLNLASSGKLERVAWYAPGIKQIAKWEGKVYFNGQLQDHGITSVVEFKRVQ